MAGAEAQGAVTRRIFLRGMVQGVGMRPFLALLAKEFGITGSVKNIGSNVEIVASADAETLDAFIAAIQTRKPEMAEIAEIIELPLSPAGDIPLKEGDKEIVSQISTSLLREVPATASGGSCSTAFTILPSTAGEVAMLPADFPICTDCMRELLDEKNRRFRHLFISCAVCGPRYSILERVPYDRDTTSMIDYPMCPACAEEYADPANRRYHAQTVCCHDCGPTLLWRDRTGEWEGEAALEKAARCLKDGGIAAIKGIGGYHLACDPNNGQAVSQLRALKGRELKPFAVMFPDMAALRRYCDASEQEQELLLSPARPIVLLKTRRPFDPAVCGDALLTGCFLPYTAMQLLLLKECGPLVMTSANQSGKPEIHEDGPMLAMLAREELAGVLYHKRRIVTRLDDSVARISAGQRQLIRRARGYAPRPVSLSQQTGKETPGSGSGMGWSHPSDAARLCIREPRPYQETNAVVAYGSDLKSAFCLLKGGEAHMSQYFGDMEEQEVRQAYEQNLAHMQRLFGFTPQLAACDLHPGYHSSRLARASGLPVVTVQHHHAHIASVMAEHHLAGPVIGVAFDGTGYGTDGAIWGGEFLLCEGGSFRRAAHLKVVTLAGGDSVAVDARKAALCYCEAAGVPYEESEGAGILRAALQNHVNTAQYSSMGRLFDAVASLLGICHTNGYEGQCAIALENAANLAEQQGVTPLPMAFGIEETTDGILIETTPVIRAIAAAGAEQALAAALGFHNGVCGMALDICTLLRERHGMGTVALSGGTFQNERILSGCMAMLGNAGFSVYTNNEVPCNDGGLALGQAYIAARKTRQE